MCLWLRASKLEPELLLVDQIHVFGQAEPLVAPPVLFGEGRYRKISEKALAKGVLPSYMTALRNPSDCAVIRRSSAAERVAVNH